MAPNSTQGATLTINGTAITKRTRIKAAETTRAKIETTDLDSTAEESIGGIERNGEYEFDILWDASLASHAALWSARVNNTTDAYVYTLPSTGTPTWSFSAWVSSMTPPEAQTDTVQRLTVKIQVTGAVTLTP